MQSQPVVLPFYRVLLIIWWSFCFSIVLLGVVAHFALAEFPPVSFPNEAPIADVLIVSAMLIAAFSLGLFRRRQSQRGATAAMDPAEETRNSLRRVPLAVVNFALNEVVAIFGFVLALLERDFHRFLPFGAAALILSVIMYPKEGK